MEESNSADGSHANFMKSWTVVVVSGPIVFLVLYFTAWFSVSYAIRVRPNQFRTWMHLGRGEAYIEEFHQSHKMYPDELNETEDFARPNDDFIDAWGNPMQYHRTESGYELFSFGRDGKKGGFGFDADLHSDRRNWENTHPTYQQFYLTFDEEEVMTTPFIEAAAMAGFLTSCLTFLSMLANLKLIKSNKFVLFVFNCITITVLAAIVGFVLMPVHIPSGH